MSKATFILCFSGDHRSQLLVSEISTKGKKSSRGGGGGGTEPVYDDEGVLVEDSVRNLHCNVQKSSMCDCRSQHNKRTRMSRPTKKMTLLPLSPSRKKRTPWPKLSNKQQKNKQQQLLNPPKVLQKRNRCLTRRL